MHLRRCDASISPDVISSEKKTSIFLKKVSSTRAYVCDQAFWSIHAFAKNLVRNIYFMKYYDCFVFSHGEPWSLWYFFSSGTGWKIIMVLIINAGIFMKKYCLFLTKKRSTAVVTMMPKNTVHGRTRNHTHFLQRKTTHSHEWMNMKKCLFGKWINCFSEEKKHLFLYVGSRSVPRVVWFTQKTIQAFVHKEMVKIRWKSMIFLLTCTTSRFSVSSHLFPTRMTGISVRSPLMDRIISHMGLSSSKLCLDVTEYTRMKAWPREAIYRKKKQK